MFDKFFKSLRSLDLEEQIFHGATALALISLFLPWFGGQWYGTEQLWTGVEFYTAYVGRVLVLLHVFMLVMGLSPAFGGPVIVKRSMRSSVRLYLSSISTILFITCYTVLIRTSMESSAHVMFGLYIAIVTSGIATLYASLRHAQFLKNQSKESFRHPEHPTETAAASQENESNRTIPPPPPPPPLPAEDHHPTLRT